MLTVSDGTHTANIKMVGSYTLANFNFATDSNGGTLVTEITNQSVTIAPIEGNNIINATEAVAGVTLGGTVSGVAGGSNFNVTVTDNGATKTYVATVNGVGTTWSATIPATDATALANGTATITALVTGANGNQVTASQTVTVNVSGPTVTIVSDPTTDVTIGIPVGGQVPYVAGLTDGGYAVAWTQYNSSVGSWETYVQVVHNGVLSAPYAIASSAIPGDGLLRDPYVAATASGFLVGWFQGSNNSQYGLNFNNEGTAVGSPFLLAPNTDEEVGGTLAAYTSGPYAGQIVNAWEQTSGGINDVNDIFVSVNRAHPLPQTSSALARRVQDSLMARRLPPQSQL